MTTAIDLATFSDYKVADITLAEWGRRELAIAETEMPAPVSYTHLTLPTTNSV